MRGHKIILLETEVFPSLIQIDMNKNNIIPNKMYKKPLKEKYYEIQSLHFSSSGKSEIHCHDNPLIETISKYSF